MNEIDLLITRKLIGHASVDEVQRLNEWIKMSPENARHFAVEAFAFRCIEDQLSGSARMDRHAGSKASRVGSMRLAHHRPMLKLAAALVIVASLIAVILLSSTGTEHPARVGAIVGSSAYVQGPAPTGLQELNQGVLVLRFASTAEVILEAPSRFEIIDEKRIALHSGKAVVLCPTEEAHGFVVQTPNGTLKDLGTEFGVSVASDGDATAVVFDGAIELTSTHTQAVRLEAGDAWRVDAQGKGQSMASADAPIFVRHGELALMQRTAKGGPASQWATVGVAMTDDPTLMLWLDMNPVADGTGLINHADPTAPAIQRLDARPLRTRSGRLEGDKALRFDQAEDQLRFDLPGEYQALTFAAWVKFDGVDQSDTTHRGLVMSDGWGNRGQVHWQAKGADFRLSFFDRGNEVDPRFPASPQGLSKDGWHLLVSSISARHGEVRHYLDGKLVDRRSIGTDMPPLTIGQASIGGWRSDYDEPRVLKGTIDDLLIWTRPLSDAEVQRLYEGSRPKN